MIREVVAFDKLIYLHTQIVLLKRGHEAAVHTIQSPQRGEKLMGESISPISRLSDFI